MKKRLIFPGKPVTKKKKKKKILSKLDSPDKDVKSTEQSILPENHDAPNDAEGERIIRKSTRTAVVVRQAERDAIRAALQATMKVGSSIGVFFLLESNHYLFIHFLFIANSWGRFFCIHTLTMLFEAFWSYLHRNDCSMAFIRTCLCVF